MPMDEMSPEYQQRLEEHIRQQIIEQNMESAMENSPEVFSDVYMLYVNMQINNIDLKVGWVPSSAGVTPERASMPCTSQPRDTAGLCGLRSAAQHHEQECCRKVRP